MGNDVCDTRQGLAELGLGLIAVQSFTLFAEIQPAITFDDIFILNIVICITEYCQGLCT